MCFEMTQCVCFMIAATTLCGDKRFNIMFFSSPSFREKRSQHTIAEKHKQSGLLYLLLKTRAVPNVFLLNGWWVWFFFFLSSRKRWSILKQFPAASQVNKLEVRAGLVATSCHEGQTGFIPSFLCHARSRQGAHRL